MFQVFPLRISGMNFMATHNELQASDRRLFGNEGSGRPEGRRCSLGNNARGKG